MQILQTRVKKAGKNWRSHRTGIEGGSPLYGEVAIGGARFREPVQGDQTLF